MACVSVLGLGAMGSRMAAKRVKSGHAGVSGDGAPLNLTINAFDGIRVAALAEPLDRPSRSGVAAARRLPRRRL